MYDSWFKIWKESYLPKLFFKPKWYNTDTDLKVGDLVWFIKEESKLSNNYTMGMVEQVNTGKDGFIRRVVVKYYNWKENHPRFTDRAARSLVRIFSAEEACLSEDLAELQEFLDEKKSSEEAVDDQIVDVARVDVKLGGDLAGCDDVDTSSQASFASNIKQVQVVPTVPEVDEILENSPFTCNSSESFKFVLASNDCEGYRTSESKVQEVDYMDKLSQVIMSVNMDLQ